MNRKHIKKALPGWTHKIDATTDKSVKAIQKPLLNAFEYLISENDALHKESQKLRDENNRLKGEQGKPKIRPQTKGNKDHSSEKDRKPRGENSKKKRESKEKKNKIKADRKEICKIDKAQLPSDAQFKGYDNVIIQDISIKTDNVEFSRECYYSPSQKKTYMAKLPDGYQGEFGPNIKAIVIDLHQSSKMTESAIHTFLTNQGVVISAATISRLITNNHDLFHQEKKDIISAGLASSVYQQMDDTGARVKGKNCYVHILCNPYYTAFFTRPRKDRLTILEILTQDKLTFAFNESSYAFMEQLKLSKRQLARLIAQQPQALMSREEVDAFLLKFFPNPKTHKTHRRIILEASALAAYQELPHAVRILLTDNAPQFKQITELLALCWIHDGRHYKKLSPFVPIHKKELDDFLTQYWDYYHKLLDYKEHPNKEKAESLGKEFDDLFSTKTGYQQLDDRIKKTKLKKVSLLLVLEYPTLPLHNNASELGARFQARYRDISQHTMNHKGTEAKDTFMTIVETAKKLGVNFFRYLLDRITKKNEMPSLAEIIRMKTQEMACNPC